MNFNLPDYDTLYTHLSRRASEEPDTLLYANEGASFTCREIKQKVDETAASLYAMGIREGSRVLLRTEKNTETVVMLLALMAIGALTMVVDNHTDVLDFFSEYKFEGVERYITRENNTCWNLVSKNWEDLRIVPCERDYVRCTDSSKPAILLPTSGSTGEPKLVVLSQFNLINNLTDAYSSGDYREGDVALGVLPLNHVFGLVLLFGSLVIGYGIVFPTEFTTLHLLECIEKYEITRINAVPSIYLDMARHIEEFNITKLRTGFVGGSPCTRDQFVLIEEKLGMYMIPAYGMSECTSISIGDPFDSEKNRSGSVGKCYSLSKIKIINEDGLEVEQGESGEICVKGPTQMLGYVERLTSSGPLELITITDGEGFTHTGDVGYFDEDGYLFINGRIRDIIIRNGINIFARRVEEKLLEIRGIRDAAVVGCPDERYGEVPVAMVVGDISERELYAELELKLSKNEIPVKIVFTDSLPKTLSGKTNKKEIAKILAS